MPRLTNIAVLTMDLGKPKSHHFFLHTLKIPDKSNNKCLISAFSEDFEIKSKLDIFHSAAAQMILFVHFISDPILVTYSLKMLAFFLPVKRVNAGPPCHKQDDIQSSAGSFAKRQFPQLLKKHWQIWQFYVKI